MIIKFTHGSKTKFDKFEYFNYIINGVDNSVTNMSTKDIIATNGFGNDKDGQGVYGVINGKPEDVQYYSQNNGHVYFCSVEVDRLCNDIDIGEVDLDKWNRVIDLTYKKIDLYHNYDSEIAEQLISKLHDDSEHIDAFAEYFDNAGIDVDEFADRLRDGEDSYDVVSDLEEYLSYETPSGSMKENQIINYDRIYNVAELIQDTTRLFTKGSAMGLSSYNKYFYDAFKEIYGKDHGYVAYTGEDNVIIVFDLEEISIDNRIDLEKRNKTKERDRESELAM